MKPNSFGPRPPGECRGDLAEIPKNVAFLKFSLGTFSIWNLVCYADYQDLSEHSRSDSDTHPSVGAAN
ncbi:MAG: hypothetical protein ACM35G_14795, partial [Planctomycetaceae bacterium]